MQVRFQPRIGHLLAAASDKVVSIFDVESDRQIHSLQVSGFVNFTVDPGHSISNVNPNAGILPLEWSDQLFLIVHGLIAPILKILNP